MTSGHTDCGNRRKMLLLRRRCFVKNKMPSRYPLEWDCAMHQQSVPKGSCSQISYDIPSAKVDCLPVKGLQSVFSHMSSEDSIYQASSWCWVSRFRYWLKIEICVSGAVAVERTRVATKTRLEPPPHAMV